MLLDSGATLVGKTHLDELAYSLNGENAHYGTPLNVAEPSRIPGGSSSGSAAAVAGGVADIGLGTDTAGSVRVPASYCGLHGFRPTHGRVPLQGVVPLAESFDTVGWFARNATVLRLAGQALLGPQPGAAKLDRCRWIVATDAFDLADDETRQAVYDALSCEFAAVASVLGSPSERCVASKGDGGSLESWLDVFRTIQSWEAWQNHGAWIEAEQPSFGPGIRERFEAAARTTRGEAMAARAERERIARRVHDLLGEDGVLAVPTCPGPAPLLDTPVEELEAFRRRLLSLTSLAPLCGLPQVTLPIAAVNNLPVGWSLIGPKNSDEGLLRLAEKLMGILPAQTGR
mmetsp:Transcript_39155/g.92738  ORF Transcript_39155/g.92738 Transcript_39155/m.92738 type:complete len:344 (-) Transcript_39155:430-1461(-)